MKAEDWQKLGRAIQSNADLLQDLALAEDSWLPMPDNPNKDLAWLISKGLIDTEDDELHISGLLIDLGAQISLQGFERAAPDLEEALIAVQQLSAGYLESKRDGADDAADRYRRRLSHTLRQIILHLRDDYLATRSFIEGNMGYAISPAERLRVIQGAIERIKRLHSKLTLFSYDPLRQIAHGDRELIRLLTGLHSSSLHAAIVQRRQDFTTLLARLDNLSVSVRKRTRFRQLYQTLDSFMMAGNTLDVPAMMADTDNSALFVVPSLHLGGMLPPPEQTGEAVSDFELLLGALPEPKDATPESIDEAGATAPALIPVRKPNQQAMNLPFAHPHLQAMIKAMRDTGQPQSAARYWAEHGDRVIEPRHWMYALSGYYLRLARERGGKNKMECQLIPRHREHLAHDGMRKVIDLLVVPHTERSRGHYAYAR